MSSSGHRQTGSVSQNHKAQLATAYNELGKELSSQKIRVVGNYTLGKVIGEGTYGKVRMGTHRLTGARVAIKQIPKGMSASLTREIHHHRQLHHPHVTQLFEVIATENNIWLVTELCSGGELFDYLAEKGRLSEEETRIFFGQLCLAVAYVHEKGIVHRDLKLENVLLDERCRVKLGDFGFTREFERGVLLETFCGTTGYASPEMLLSQKYLGPGTLQQHLLIQVDVWSLGVILYTLLTGMLPFDDDDESIMRAKVIRGEFEDPEWLSDDARDLLRNVLQVEPTKRFTIEQILSHSWFTSPKNAPPANDGIAVDSRSVSPTPGATSLLAVHPIPISSDASDATYHSASSEFSPSTPSTPPEDALVDVVQGHEYTALNRVASDSTLKMAALNLEKHALTMDKVQEEADFLDLLPIRPSLSRATTASHTSAKDPPALPTRTPARTKRRSVSSTLSDSASPTTERHITITPPQDFSLILSTPAPLIFSTPLERDLLNSLSTLGFDTGQIVHSVLTDACDATGALWWMLKRRAERKALEEGPPRIGQTESQASTVADPEPPRKTHDKGSKSRSYGRASREERQRAAIPATLVSAQSAPELQLIPATPTVASGKRPTTPPRALSPTNPLLSPTSTGTAESGARSHPSTPGGSMKDKDGSKGRKGRSGSVSIMQRATTALEAAGLVKKKSAEVVRDDKEKNNGKRADSGDEPRSSHASSSKLTKSPPLKPVQDEPHTPPNSMDSRPIPAHVGSPWLLANARQSPPPTPANSPPGSLGGLPTIKENSGKMPNSRNRASLLTTVRMWFKEDAKGKRKEAPPPLAPQSLGYHVHGPGSPSTSPVNGRGRGTIKRRTSLSRPKVTVGRKTANRAKRGSVSSRRSSSVNSKRSSVTSTQMALFESVAFSDPMPPVTRQRSDPSRRSFGAHTPNSESRPSSVHSISMHPRHRKSPSASSAGSWYPGRTASPLPKNHRRAGSGSSTRVVRQTSQGTPFRQTHLRSNSASSNHSLASSRHGSLYELSETESHRIGTPTRRFAKSPVEETPKRNSPATFVAQKRQTPFSNSHSNGSGYLHSIGRSSWKKSWGMEPPGWQTRTAQAPTIEVLAISPAVSTTGIRDVFTGRQSLSLGDESDWVDEDDDVSGYAGGLGQLPSATSTSFPSPIEVSPPLRGHVTRPPQASSSSRRSGGSSNSAPHGNRTDRTGRSKNVSRTSAGRSSPAPTEPIEAPPEARGGRRQLPNARAKPAFRLPIQEEDEDEE
ncbi:Pkinase-domain-containing protein [Trametopsis cervina]|nr:Pkinase-domain-containing protein [Trametopsis cervina]